MKILTIENKAAKVRLDDQVDEYSRKQLMAEIAKTYGCANIGNVAEFGEITNAVDNAIDTLEIEINSPGGSVFDGYLIFNEIKALRARGVVVTATINPLAASMGSVIAMAADTVRIVEFQSAPPVKGATPLVWNLFRSRERTECCANLMISACRNH